MLYYELFTGTCTRNRCYAISFTGTCTRCYAISFTKGILNCIILQNRVGGKQHFSINRIGMTNGSKNWMCETCADKHVRTRTCLTIRRFTVLPIIYIYILYIYIHMHIYLYNCYYYYYYYYCYYYYCYYYCCYYYYLYIYIRIYIYIHILNTHILYYTY